MSIVLGVISYLLQYTWLFGSVLFFQAGYQFSPLKTGMALLPYSIALSIASFTTGYILSKATKNIRLSILLMLIAAMVISFLIGLVLFNSDLILIEIISFFLGLLIPYLNSFSLHLALANNAKADGEMIGTIFMIRWIGGIAGIVLITLLMNFFSLSSAIANGFIIITLVLLGIIALTWFRKNKEF